MATNMFKKYTESLTREWDVPAGTLSGTVVIHPVSSKIGVTITARGDVTTSQVLPDGTTRSGIPAGGVGNRPTGAVVARDGSWLLTVGASTNGSTATGGTGTPAGTSVYRVTASGAYTTAAVTATINNVLIGVIDDGTIVGGIAPVQIGN